MPTGIDYLTDTWSPITGCSGQGCKVRDNCWARDMVKRFPQIHGWEINQSGERLFEVPIPFNRVHFHPSRLDKPLHWKKPRRVGVCFMGDWMDEQVQCGWIDQILEVIGACPHHQFFSLTKQPQNLEEKIYGHCPESPVRELGGGDYLPNLWHGVSITDQEDADRMIPELLKVPGKRWVSVEPMLGPVDLLAVPAKSVPGYAGLRFSDMIHWIVLGCESGPERRPCKHEWMIDVVRQCKAAGVKCYVKQIDMGHVWKVRGRVSHNPEEWPSELRIQELG